MSINPPTSWSRAVTAAVVGALLVALAIYASSAYQLFWLAAIAGAAGLALWRLAALGRWLAPALVFDLIAFGIFAFQRNDGLVFWQLVGPWADVARFNAGEAMIADFVYILGALFTLTSAHRPLRPIEAISLIAIPFLFNFVVAMGADWHMAEVSRLLIPGNTLSFPIQVFIGRGTFLFLIAEFGLTAVTLIRVNRWPGPLTLHGLVLGVAALAAATPLIANFAQIVTQPFLAIFVGAAAAGLAQAGLWSMVYIATGVPLDALAGRPPRLAAIATHARDGLIKGAIYGGVFMAVVLTLALFLREPVAVTALRFGAVLFAPIGGALAFPFAQVLIGSADGAPPFFGRLRAAYRDPSAYARGVVVGIGCWLAYALDLASSSGGDRFLFAFVVGALAYAGVDAAFDYNRIRLGQRAKLPTWRRYALGAGLGGIVAGALGWYFDAPQLQVVIDKFWAYADVNYRVGGHHLGDFTTYPLFNKYGAVNLGEVAGGVRLFWSESVAGVINWGVAAPLFSLNYVLLAALLERSLQPLRGMFSLSGAQGLIEQFVRVLRWGLWMSPIINSFLRQSPDPSWFNQDGAVRTLVAIGADVGLPSANFRDFSLTLFLGLLAYDWLRVLIWFDHMGLRVATLVNLSFLGGDRADEAAGRFLRHGARTRAIPDGIRRFGTWAPLLIPFYIPRGAEWDKAWTGAEALTRGGPMPDAVKVLAGAYAVAVAGLIATAFVVSGRMREKPGAAAPRLPGAPAALDGLPGVFSANNGAVAVEVWRDGRGATSVMGMERAGGPIDLTRRPLDPLEQRGHFFYLSEGDAAPWSIGYAPARRAGDYSIEQTAFNQVTIVNVVDGVRASMTIGPDRNGAVLSWRVRLTDLTGAPRKLRLTSFCEIAGHETGAYARDLDFAGMHVETMFVRSLNAILARNRLLRSARAHRGETAFFAVKPGHGDGIGRLRGFAHPVSGRRLAGQANRLRAAAVAPARRPGQAVDVRSGRQLHARCFAAAQWRGERGVHHRALR